MSGISSKAAGSITNKLKYSSKEEQSNEFSDGSGLEFYDYGARFYDRQLGRWPSIDELAESYSSFSPYNFVLDNPVNGIDPDGRDVIFINDTKAVGGLGHGSVIIGNSTEGWFYYSLNGTEGDKGKPFGNSFNPDIGIELKSRSNNVNDLITEVNNVDEGSEKHSYTKYIRVKTSKEEDELMKAKAEKAASVKKYILIGQSCINVQKETYKALVSRRVPLLTTFDQDYKSTINSVVPNLFLYRAAASFNQFNRWTSIFGGTNFFLRSTTGGPVVTGDVTGNIVPEKENSN